jgi:hypothetical protein
MNNIQNCYSYSKLCVRYDEVRWKVEMSYVWNPVRIVAGTCC